jgi:hypothetical protein
MLGREARMALAQEYSWHESGKKVRKLYHDILK